MNDPDVTIAPAVDKFVRRLPLRGVAIEVQETPGSSGFRFRDPKQVSTCGTHGQPASDLPEYVHAH